MAKRKNISISNSLGRVNALPSIGNTRLVSTDAILSMANKLSKQYGEEAYNSYNASLFPEIKLDVPTIPSSYTPDNDVIKISTAPTKTKKTSSSYSGDRGKFVNDIYESYYKAVRPGAASDADADRQARFLTQKAAFETGWGKHIANTHNYGGHKGKNGWLSFNSMDDFTRKDVALLDKKWGNWRNAKNEGQFIDAINTNNGYGMYAPPTENTNYKGRYSSLTSGINNTINMGRRKLRCGGKTDRPKAWIGAVVGAAGSILGSIFSSDAQRRQQEELRRQQEHQAALERAEGLTESLGLMQAAQKEYENRFRVNYANGGRRRLRQGVQITDGGAFVNSSTGRVYGPGDNIPNGVYDVLDYTHEEENPSGNNGNGIKVGHKNIEVEKGERIIKDNDEIFVESNTIKIPTPYGLDTAANADRAGVDRTYVKRIQQSLNGNYNGDRTREAIKKIGRKNYLRGYNIIDHMRNGGYITRPVERIIAENGIVIRNGRKQKWVNYPNSNNGYWQDMGPVGDRISGTTSGVRNGNSFDGFIRNVAGYIPYGRQILNYGENKKKTKSEGNNEVKKLTAAEEYFKRTGIKDTPENRRLYELANRKGQSTTAGMEYTGTKNGGNLREVTVLGNKPKSVLALGNPVIAGSNDKDLSFKKTAFTMPSMTDVYTALAIQDLPSSKSKSNTSGNTYTPDYTSQQEANYIKSQINKNANTVGTGKPTTVTDGNYFGLDYTDQQMLDYINNNINKPNEEVHYTNPNEAILREGVSGQRTDMNTGTYIQNNNNEFGKTNKWGTVFKGSDWIGLGADLIGSLGSALINYNAAKNIGDPAAPVRVSPGKLITNWNIAPRLSEVNMLRNRMLRDSDEAVSSAARLNRRNSINMFTNNQADKLWGEKTNREVELLNQDALNQQQVNAQNVAAYNDYLNRLYDARTRRGLMKSQALQVGLSGLSDAVGNFLDQGKQRYSDQQAMRYYTALLPESGRQWLRRNGVDFLRRGGRIK